MSTWITTGSGRRAGSWLAVLIAAAVLVPARVSADQVTGSIKTRVRAGASAAVPVVYAERLDGPAPSRPGTFVIAQRGKTFAPRVLVVPGGSSVSFPNEDPIFHNVFSLSQPQPFDLGLYRSGAAKTRTFTEPAVYHIFCNIHPQMVAFLVVAPSPWVATAGPDGAWQLDVPPGRYRITALSERASPVSIEIVVGGKPTEAPPIALDESVAMTTPHLNKFGKPYPKAAYSDR
jgi:plastocyanin